MEFDGAQKGDGFRRHDHGGCGIESVQPYCEMFEFRHRTLHQLERRPHQSHPDLELLQAGEVLADLEDKLHELVSGRDHTVIVGSVLQ